MPPSLSLSELLAKGYVRKVTIQDAGFEISPEKFRRLILGGIIHHVTGTQSSFAITDTHKYDSPGLLYVTRISSPEASQDYPLYGKTAEPYQTDWTPFIIQPGWKLWFFGATGASYINLLVLEWEI